ncbi:MAG: beta-propeller domain-containing protein [Polyangiaceae bacterium]
MIRRPSYAAFLPSSPFRVSTALAVLPLLATAACSSTGTESAKGRVTGQTDFISAPAGQSGGASFGDKGVGAPTAAGAANDSSSEAAGGRNSQGGAVARAVEETDIYRLEGDRLFVLNGYRGLLVFDVSNRDEPVLVGRSPIFGSPVEMVVRQGVATVVVADWYGTMDDGTPFHGSVVRGLDARDPANIKVLGEARLGGWVRDTRVVGDVLYAISQDYGWYYGWGGYYGEGVAVSPGGVANTSKVVVSSVGFKDGVIREAGRSEFPGYGGLVNVTPKSILLAHDVTYTGDGPYPANGAQKSELQYIDIQDPAGAIALRGKIEVPGSVQSWGADNGRWNLDFADGRRAHVLAMKYDTNGNGRQSYALSTVDFGNPDAPTVASTLDIAGQNWSVAARFDANRLYLTPDNNYWDGTSSQTPLQIYDLLDAANPKFAGSTSIDGSIWNLIPSGNDRLFGIGGEYNRSSNKVTLTYLNVADAAHPSVIGKAAFGDGWAWTPAAGTFKAFTRSVEDGLAVLPFSGWSDSGQTYTNGLQLVEFSENAIGLGGAAKTKGWVERGVFVKGRLYSLSDLALSVVDYTNHAAPAVVKELTLARNVVSAEPQGNTVAELSTDWWGNDTSTSQLRVLPIENAEENTHVAPLADVAIAGTNAQVFRNGNLAYVVSTVREEVSCATGPGGVSDPGSPGKDGTGTVAPKCYAYGPQVQVVDLSNGAALRGKIKLPTPTSYWGGYGWGGCYWYDWFDGSDAVQVGGDKLAFRRMTTKYNPDGTWTNDQTLYVVGLTNPDAPTLGLTLVSNDSQGWWGNMRASGSVLYTSHYEWVNRPDPRGNGTTQYSVRYYLDQIDVSNPVAPRVATRINVPGMLVGVSESDPSILYTVDYRYNTGTNDQIVNDFDVLKVDGGLAYLQSTLPLDGYVGRVIVKGAKAYATTQKYNWGAQTEGPTTKLHELDVTNPAQVVDRVASEKGGFGWLLGVEGDRALVQSGWSNAGIDIYRLTPGAAPAYERFVRTRGWWQSSLARQGNQLFVSSGYWGTQVVALP